MPKTHTVVDILAAVRAHYAENYAPGSDDPQA